MIAHLTETQIMDIKIGLTAFALFVIFRVGLYAYDTRHDFDRPKKHGSMDPPERKRVNNEGRYKPTA